MAETIAATMTALRQPCVDSDCDARLMVWQEWSGPIERWVFQHGPNEEHRLEISQAELLTVPFEEWKSYPQRKAQGWLSRIHAPRPWEVEASP